MSLHPEIAAVLAGQSKGCVVCGDCLEIMADMPDGCVECVVTDPPYGIGEAAGKNKSRRQLAAPRDYGNHAWDNQRRPKAEIDEARRVSGHQVIFGGNYYADMLPPSASWISWDKDNSGDFADVELAWTSHGRAARKVRWRWNGMLQEPGFPRDERWHPTQKPLGLMLWVIENYTEHDHIIFDPYMGSGTTCVAAKKLGRRYIGIDIEPKYVEIARRRLASTPEPLFVPEEPQESEEQLSLFGETK